MTLIAGAATGFGGALVLFKKKLSSNFLAGALGVSAGVMIFISLAELYPEAQAEIAAIGSIPHGKALVLLAFFIGMGINLHSDHIIRHLRKPGDTKHYIPRKGFYKYVTSANYFGEFTEWIGYAILTWSPAGLLFAIWTFANLGPRAKSLTEKYEKEFGEEYTKLNKKHIIPFIW